MRHMWRNSPSMPRFVRATALAAALLVGIVTGGSASAVLSNHSIVAAPQAPVAPARATDAIRQVIQQANAEQAQALARRDPTLMADTATADHQRELEQVNQDLVSSGVASIRLTRLEWGPVDVTGSTATATTYETWTVQYQDGSSRTSRDTNVYTLVNDNGAWKIQSNEHPGAAPSSPAAPAPSLPTAPGPSQVVPGF